MPRYNHAYTIAFSLISTKEDGSDVTNDMLAEALKKRVEDCQSEKDSPLLECSGAPFDTYEIEDTIELKHKTPCHECPWRRASPQGYLGGFKVEDFVNQVKFDGPPLQCHTASDFDNGKLFMCAGALIYMKNTCKAPYHKDYGDALKHVERDTEKVFQWASEFEEHHSSGFKPPTKEE